MNPREFLREGGYPIALLTTYSFDPIFFERFILPDLWAGGSGSVIVFVDRRELARSLDSCVPRLRHIGRRYFLVPVDVPGAFHSKVFLRLREEDGLAWVGSGNLTRGGWGANSELASGWRIGAAGQDAGAWIPELLDALEGHASGGLAGDLLTRIRGLSWMPSSPVATDEPPVIQTWVDSLAVQLERRWAGRRFRTLKLLTGSTDADAAMLRWAVDQLGVDEIDICMTPERASFDAPALAALDATVRFLPAPDEKPVHAKFFWFDGPDGPAAVWGSANASRSGWLLAGRNAEAVVVVDTPPSAPFASLLSLFEGTYAAPDEVLVPGRALPDEERATLAPLTIIRINRDASEMVAVSVEPAVDSGSDVWLEAGEVDIELRGRGGEWLANVEDVDRAESSIVRLRVERSGQPVEWSRPHWIDVVHELREVLAGRDFRSSMEALRSFKSRAADYRLAHELGRIGFDLLHDSAAYPDPPASPRQRDEKSGEKPPPAPLDPAELLVSLGQMADDGPPGLRDLRGGGSVSGVFRALFARSASVDDDAAVLDDTDDEPNNKKKRHPEPRLGSDETQASADSKAQKLLRRHMDGFFKEFESPEFVATCTATQLVQAVAYPIAVSMMSVRREWCTVEVRREWLSKAVRGLLQRDHFHGRSAMIAVVRDRYRETDRSDVFDRAIGDGQLWLAVLIAADGLSENGEKDRLVKLTLFRDLLRRHELLGSADPANVRALFRDYFDAEALKATGERVLRLGAVLLRFEATVGAEHEALRSEHLAAGHRHRAGDLVWSQAGGWGFAETDQTRGRFTAYVSQAGDVRKFHAEHWLNVPSLATRQDSFGEQARELLSLLDRAK